MPIPPQFLKHTAKKKHGKKPDSAAQDAKLAAKFGTGNGKPQNANDKKKAFLKSKLKSGGF